MDEEEPLYDEFGNYIGPELDSSSSSDSDFEPEREEKGESERKEEEEEEEEERSADERAAAAPHTRAVVLAEDKKHYEDADEIFGEGVEVRVEDEDTQPLETPVIAPVKERRFERVEEGGAPETTFGLRYLAALMDRPALARCAVLAGALGHGKTTLMDLLVQQTHRKEWPLEGEVRYTDAREDEQLRGMSVKATPMSLVMPDLRGKSRLLNLVDAPGHPDLCGEVAAAARVCDGMVLVVCAVEGVLEGTRRALRLAARDRLAVCLVVAKVDRLLLDLKLPPRDAYQKLLHTVEAANRAARAAGLGGPAFAPGAGNVCFASARHGWCFSLLSFAERYAERAQAPVDAARMARRLWGDAWFDARARRFVRARPEDGGDGDDGAPRPPPPRSFVQFVMEPLHKMYAHTLGGQGRGLRRFADSVGVRLNAAEAALNPSPLLRLVLSRFFGPAACVAEMLSRHVPSPPEAAGDRVRGQYGGDLGTPAARAMLSLDAGAALAVVHVAKLVPRPDASRFDSFGRVACGTLRTGDRVRVLGESYAGPGGEDMAVREVTCLWVWQGRYRVRVNRVTAGNWALIEGVEESVRKTATLVSDRPEADAHGGVRAFRPLRFDTVPSLRVALEPIHPADLPKVVEGLRAVDRSYPMLRTRVEESGEHVVVGNGEMHMDLVLHDLRRMYSEAEVKVADPLASFRETAGEASSTRCFADTPNGRNRLAMLCEPLAGEGLAADLCAGGAAPRAEELRQKYGWDALAARSVWAFGPEVGGGPNVLLDDTLPADTDARRLGLVRPSVVQGFQWAAREGPLCDEPMHGCSFRLIGADVAERPLDRPAGQVIPTARRVAYGAFLLAAPRLMEPVYRLEVLAPAECVPLVHKALGRRRGNVARCDPLPGTPLFVMEGYAPLMDLLGLETDVRTVTAGAAFVTSWFHSFAVVPGDPLDATVQLRPLEPAPVGGLARDFMVKTRRRKGLSEGVSPARYFGEEMLLALAKEDEELREYLDEDGGGE